MEHSVTHSLSLAIGALATWRIPERTLTRPTRPKYIWPEAERTLHLAVSRAVGPEDAVYLRARPVEARALARHLRSSREAFLKTYLSEMRASFDQTSRTVRQFAADADAPDLAFAALRQSIRFYTLWLVLRASLVCNLVGPAWRLTERMLGEAHLGGRPEAQNPVETVRS